MNSVRRSNRFDKAQLVTVTLRKGTDGFGLELGGTSPPIIAGVCKYVYHHTGNYLKSCQKC